MNNDTNSDNKKFKIITILMFIISFVFILQVDFKSVDLTDGSIKAVISEYHYLIYIFAGISLIVVTILKFNYLQFLGGIFTLIGAICLFMFYKNSNPDDVKSILTVLIMGIGFFMVIKSIQRNKLLVILEDTEIKDDIEKWVQDVNICWVSISTPDSELNKISGKDKNGLNVNRYRKRLRLDWGINNKQELLEKIEGLTTESLEFLRKELTIKDIKIHNVHIESCLAWDMCRAVQIIGAGYIADYLTRDEMREYSIKACKLIQKEFDSWDDLLENYLRGCKDSIGSDRRHYYEALKNKKLAYQLDWNLNLE